MIDTNVNLGPWPFAPIPEFSAGRLVAHLAENGIGKALVSHLGAVFLPDPTPANATLFAQVRRTPELRPVPILNPVLANWREQLETCRAEADIRAVKILPNFHNYRLRPKRLEAFMTALDEAGLKLILNLRFEDERHKYFALRIKGVPTDDIASFLTHFSSHHVLLTGAYKPEVETLAKTHPNCSAEIAFCEWHQTVPSLLETVPADRLMLGTGTPLLSTRAGVDKLRGALIPEATKALIGSGNVRRFLGL